MGGNGDGEMSAVCWYFGVELHDTQRVPIGLVHSSYGGSAVEDWISKATLGDGKSGPCPGPIVGSMGQPSQQYNGQLHPLLNTTIKGAIWYQGESKQVYCNARLCLSLTVGSLTTPLCRPVARSVPTATGRTSCTPAATSR